MTPPRTLVAGIGNIFFRDDGFGVEVAGRLLREAWPDHVRILDVGIRGVHLAHELMDGWDVAVLVDAGTSRGGTRHGDRDRAARAGPSTHDGAEGGLLPLVDGHGMAPVDVLALLPVVGARVGRVLLVACEPAETGEGLGLSAPVAAAVDRAVAEVRSLVASR